MALAVRALLQIDSDRAVDRLIDALSGTPESVRVAATVGLSAVGAVDTRVLTALTETLADPAPAVRGTAMGTCESSPGELPRLPRSR